MFIYLRLLLAHFIGDYLLQFDVIYNLKLRGLRGLLPHILLIFLSFLITCWPYLHIKGLWLFLGFVVLTHLIQDWTKIKISKNKHTFYFYLLDQILHIAILSLVFFTSLKNISPVMEPRNIITDLYNNNTFILYLISIIFATYNGFFMIFLFKKNFLKIPSSYSKKEKWFGFLERAAIVSIFYLGKFFLFYILIILMVRPFIYIIGKKQFLIKDQFISLPDILLSGTIAIMTGVILLILI